MFTISAIYENGVFRPTVPVTLPDIEAAGESGMDEGGSLPWGPQ